MSDMCSVKLQKEHKWDYIAAQGPDLALSRSMTSRLFPVSMEDDYNTLFSSGTTLWMKPNMSVTADPFLVCCWAQWSGSHENKGPIEALEGPIRDMCEVNPKPPETQWIHTDLLYCYCFQSVHWVHRTFLSISHFLWIQPQSNHLFKLWSALQELVAFWAPSKQNLLVSPHQRLHVLLNQGVIFPFQVVSFE